MLKSGADVKAQFRQGQAYQGLGRWGEAVASLQVAPLHVHVLEV